MKAGFLLALNPGSSSIKLGLYEVVDGRAVGIGRGEVDLQTTPLALSLEVRGMRSMLPIDAPLDDTLGEVVDALLAQLEGHGALGDLRAIGHRVVHGGTRFHAATVVDDDALDAIASLTPLAPLHQPHSVRLMRAIRRLRPSVAQTASFDTAFHVTQDMLVRRYALPARWHDAGVMRYGFHGLSYAYIAQVLARRHPLIARGRVVAAHLGSGASLCAMAGGRSVDSSMGFSTLDGVPMSTRCGALDAGAVLYLMEEGGLDLRALEHLLYHESGLLGVSGISGDLRRLEASADPAARMALDLFAFRCAGEAARLAGSLGGLDALVFTAGIGEHAAAMRAAICSRLAWLGVSLDDAANARHAECVSSPESRVIVLVVPTDEEQVIADEAIAVLGPFAGDYLSTNARSIT
ncbi:MAG: acetate/propionate family kinase [Proteobacteria bacterium]|nr:acetate/propionate family kinase [Pseudomonadota bacterium]